MTSLTLKDLPDDLLDQVRRQADLARRSMNKEFIHLVEQGLHLGIAARQGYDPVEAKRQVAIWRKLAGQWESDPAVDDEIASIYASRTGGREVNL